jgi:Tfp pilus assembly protein FimV
MQRSEVRSQNAEVRSQNAEVRSQNAEVRSQKLRGRNAEVKATRGKDSYAAGEKFRRQEAPMQWRTSLNSVCCLLVLGLFFGLTVRSIGLMQRIPPTVSQPQGTGSAPATSPDDVQQRQARAANQQRLAEIRRDTEKMSELTQELQQYLEKADPGVVSVDAIKKAEQIEKLAHSVKSKMKQSF